ncbi:NAD(P)/FAD-dependent oxidoreductase [Longimicrobium sp.]|uniref:flavin-containing monooxygenase n=1 Tax=Longimicrobium sp. TaxID=2029185 RepID=UPI002C8864A8|nr:NAD(P)/FAD-dependent oxidoreductase [Longimicrobium sp.]HSU15486.1 NAD(P)/FAD-dependent oxidoreductase [Longimicrobium sp.]
MAEAGTRVRVAIVGSGFGGLGAAIRLKQEGITDFVLLEPARDVGGTWRDNTYPGCECDVQSHLYSFSFEPNPEWTRSFSPQPEIQAYLQRVAKEFGILPHVRFGHEVRGAAWDDAAQLWRIDTTQGPYSTRVLVMAPGALSDPLVPDIPGLDRFEGRAFHSARWDHSFDLGGKRVAVIGTGASAIQLVPAIQPRVEKLFVFQRTPPWILPRTQRRVGERTHRVYRRFPALQRGMRGMIYLAREAFVLGFRRPRAMRLAEKIARRHLAKSIADPALRAKLTPAWTIGCKRILLSNDYYPALARPNVEVVTDRISAIHPHSIVTANGAECEVDAIVFGTGFLPTDPPLAHAIRGRDGRALTEVWAGSPKAHVGTTVVGFPNLFLLMGPNTGLGHTSVVYMIEAQVEHMIAAMRHLERTGAAALEPRPEAQAAFVDAVDRRMAGTVWTAGGCRSWYLDGTGRNSALWPDFTWRFRRRVATLDPAEYVAIPPRAAAAE